MDFLFFFREVHGMKPKPLQSVTQLSVTAEYVLTRVIALEHPSIKIHAGQLVKVDHTISGIHVYVPGTTIRFVVELADLAFRPTQAEVGNAFDKEREEAEERRHGSGTLVAV